MILALPSAPPVGPAGPLSLPADLAASRLADAHVLLVEDEVVVAAEIKHALEAAGARVTYARRLERALRRAESPGLDGAILDVTLARRVTSVPVAQRLRLLGVPFVLHSGDLAQADAIVLSLGAPLVPKPAAAHDVLNALARVMAA